MKGTARRLAESCVIVALAGCIAGSGVAASAMIREVLATQAVAVEAAEYGMGVLRYGEVGARYGDPSTESRTDVTADSVFNTLHEKIERDLWDRGLTDRVQVRRVETDGKQAIVISATAVFLRMSSCVVPIGDGVEAYAPNGTWLTRDFDRRHTAPKQFDCSALL